MDVNHERFSEYEALFTELADVADEWEEDPPPELNSANMFICLYGENGLLVDEEFAMLETFKTHADNESQPLRRLDMQADYYQDIILFVL
jgi:hypothetical protein